MKKKLIIFIALLVCCLNVISPLAVQAQGELAIVEGSVQIEFPSILEFKLSAQSNAEINEIRLHYVVSRVSYVPVTSEVFVEFQPGTAVDVNWTWDMRRTGGLPPETDIDFWWTVRDSQGNEVVTSPARIQFNDLRYEWRHITENMVKIYWYEGNETFVRELMATAQQVVSRLGRDTGAYLEQEVKIYIYANSGDLQGAMVFPQEWTGGVAYPRYGTIAIGISPGNLDWGKRAMAHELAHLVAHQMTLNPYNDVPTWLDEGLAMWAEGEPEVDLEAVFKRAAAEDKLVSVRSLSSPFSAHADEAGLSYLQSYSFVEYLISSYGQDKMLELLTTFRNGSGYDAALESTYGFDMDELNTLWRNYLALPEPEPLAEAEPTNDNKEQSTSPVLLWAGAGGAVFILSVSGFALVKWTRSRRS